MLTGDLDKLGRIGAGVAALEDVPRVAGPLVSERLEALVQLEFDAGVDPYGEAWQPLAPATLAKGRRPPPLTNTREMRDSLLVYPNAGRPGVRMTIGTEDHPAGPHQTGWVGRQGSGPARPIFPTEGMPIAWESAVEDAITDAVIDKLGELR